MIVFSVLLSSYVKYCALLSYHSFFIITGLKAGSLINGASSEAQ